MMAPEKSLAVTYLSCGYSIQSSSSNSVIASVSSICVLDLKYPCARLVCWRWKTLWLILFSLVSQSHGFVFDATSGLCHVPVTCCSIKVLEIALDVNRLYSWLPETSAIGTQVPISASMILSCWSFWLATSASHEAKWHPDGCGAGQSRCGLNSQGRLSISAVFGAQQSIARYRVLIRFPMMCRIWLAAGK